MIIKRYFVASPRVAACANGGQVAAHTAGDRAAAEQGLGRSRKDRRRRAGAGASALG